MACAVTPRAGPAARACERASCRRTASLTQPGCSAPDGIFRDNFSAIGLGDLSRMLALKNLQGLDQAAKGVIVAHGLEHASLPANPLMKSAAGQGEPLSRGARLGF